LNPYTNKYGYFPLLNRIPKRVVHGGKLNVMVEPVRKQARYLNVMIVYVVPLLVSE
jgi:hypothetical protein